MYGPAVMIGVTDGAPGSPDAVGGGSEVEAGVAAGLVENRPKKPPLVGGGGGGVGSETSGFTPTLLTEDVASARGFVTFGMGIARLCPEALMFVVTTADGRNICSAASPSFWGLGELISSSRASSSLISCYIISRKNLDLRFANINLTLGTFVRF